MKIEKEEIGSSLLSTIIDNKAMELIADLGEVAIDDLLKDGTLKDIPILGDLLKLYNLGVGVRDYLFLQKLMKFLYHLKEVPDADKEQFINKVKGDKKFKKLTGENLILILERLDDLNKPELVGKAFCAYVEGKITYDEFILLSTAIDRTRISDIKALEKISVSWIFSGNSDWEQRLANCDLMTIDVEFRLSLEPGIQRETKIMYKRNSLNQLLSAVCLKNDQETLTWLEYRKK